MILRLLERKYKSVVSGLLNNKDLSLLCTSERSETRGEQMNIKRINPSQYWIFEDSTDKILLGIFFFKVNIKIFSLTCFLSIYMHIVGAKLKGNILPSAKL